MLTHLKPVKDTPTVSLSNILNLYRLHSSVLSCVADPDFRPPCGKAQAKYFLQGLRKISIMLHYSSAVASIRVVFDQL